VCLFAKKRGRFGQAYTTCPRKRFNRAPPKAQGDDVATLQTFFFSALLSLFWRRFGWAVACESIDTENSYEFMEASICALLRDSGFWIWNEQRLDGWGWPLRCGFDSSRGHVYGVRSRRNRGKQWDCLGNKGRCRRVR